MTTAFSSFVAKNFIVDAHVHFWNPQLLDYPWLAGLTVLNRTFLPENYTVASKPVGIEKMIFVECGCQPSQNRDEVKWISELAAREKRLKGIVAHASLECGVAAREELKALAQFPLVKGVRRNLQSEPDMNYCLQPDFVAGVRALAEFNFSFDLCVSHRQLPAVIQLVRRCPEITFIIDHCGKPAIRDGQLDPWRQHIRELALLPNVACKISGLVTEANPTRCDADPLRPYVVHALESFGSDRVMFGGDWPVCNLATPFTNWLNTLKEILAGESEENLTKLFQTNAERIYRV